MVGKQPRIGPAFTSAASAAVVCSIEGIVDGARPVSDDEDDLGKVRGAPNVVESPRQLLCSLGRAEGRGEDGAPTFHDARSEGRFYLALRRRKESCHHEVRKRVRKKQRHA